MGNSQTVTMQQIAEIVGVSRPVVSKVLASSSSTIRVNPKTAKKIRKIAIELGYFANSAARAMRSGKFDCISLVMSSTEPSRSLLPRELLQGIQDTLDNLGMHLVLSSLPDEKLVNEGFLPKILSELYVDGLLVNYNAHIPEQMINLINKHKIPSVWINSKQEKDCAYPDDFNGGVQAVEYLLELGHKRIMFANFGGFGHYSSYDREAGYQHAMQQAGLEPKSYVKEKPSSEIAQVAKTFLEGEQAPTAVIGYTDRDFFAFREAAVSMGLRIPQDLSLVTFRPEVPLQHIDIKATTVALQETMVGEKATEMLINKINNPGQEYDPEVVSSRLIPGNTTGIVKVVER